MREYASLMLNMIENAGIYLKKQSAEYDRILGVTVHKVIVQIAVSYRDRHIQNTIKK